jgi:hypothetical protein
MVLLMHILHIPSKYVTHSVAYYHRITIQVLKL